MIAERETEAGIFFESKEILAASPRDSWIIHVVLQTRLDFSREFK